uniref:Uncharacterized protein n=1 Tax=Heterorhabditis bacteriophora TaxID=37862 RepID=A0A1I7WCP7_HETBA
MSQNFCKSWCTLPINHYTSATISNDRDAFSSNPGLDIIGIPLEEFDANRKERKTSRNGPLIYCGSHQPITT